MLERELELGEEEEEPVLGANSSLVPGPGPLGAVVPAKESGSWRATSSGRELR